MVVSRPSVIHAPQGKVLDIITPDLSAAICIMELDTKTGAGVTKEGRSC